MNEIYVYNHAKQNNYITHDKYISNKRRKNIKFVAGSIFLINYSMVYKQFLSIDIDSLYNKLETEYIQNIESTYTHALERIISTFFL